MRDPSTLWPSARARVEHLLTQLPPITDKEDPPTTWWSSSTPLGRPGKTFHMGRGCAGASGIKRVTEFHATRREIFGAGLCADCIPDRRRVWDRVVLRDRVSVKLMEIADTLDRHGRLTIAPGPLWHNLEVLAHGYTNAGAEPALIQDHDLVRAAVNDLLAWGTGTPEAHAARRRHEVGAAMQLLVRAPAPDSKVFDTVGGWPGDLSVSELDTGGFSAPMGEQDTSLVSTFEVFGQSWTRDRNVTSTFRDLLLQVAEGTDLDHVRPVDIDVAEPTHIDALRDVAVHVDQPGLVTLGALLDQWKSGVQQLIEQLAQDWITATGEQVAASQQVGELTVRIRPQHHHGEIPYWFYAQLLPGVYPVVLDADESVVATAPAAVAMMWSRLGQVEFLNVPPDVTRMVDDLTRATTPLQAMAAAMTAMELPALTGA